ncbi:MobV family relaxase [Floridanema evergladense]|uniref:MobV family relaxase n=1 Tax=Floridaenema evergladense BLCC-F167 TaxID=3153639 RepID=A0ABV4WXL7_9CYAN
MTPQAILRIKKLKSWRSLGVAASHDMRSFPTVNADSSRGMVLLAGEGTSDGVVNLAFQKVGEQKIRKNAVVAVEIVLGVSSEYFRPDSPHSYGEWDIERLKVWQEVSNQWLKEQLKDNILQTTLHLDEASPHIHCLWIPLSEKGKLSYYQTPFGGSRNNLSKIQDSYAAAVAKLGIERGIKGSKAKHKRVKQYYQAVNQDGLELNLEKLLPVPVMGENAGAYREKAIALLTPHLDIINHQLVHRQWLLEENEKSRSKAIASERERQKLESLLQAQQEPNLEAVAWELGFDLVSRKTGIWRRGKSVIEIQDNQFFWSEEKRKGGGIVELVMQADNYSFERTVAWMQERFEAKEILSAVARYAQAKASAILEREITFQFVPPLPDKSQWERVYSYLTKTKKLDIEIINSLHETGIIYANNHGNIIFLNRSIEESDYITGATCMGTDERREIVAGTHRKAGCFWVVTGENESELIERAVIATEPIEVLSLSTLLRREKVKTIYLAVDDLRCLPDKFCQEIPEVIVAYGRSNRENQMGCEMVKLLPNSSRVLPSALSWNQQLQLSNQVVKNQLLEEKVR